MSLLLIAFSSFVLSILIYHLVKFATRSSLPLPPGPKPWPIIGNMSDLGRIPHHSLAALATTYGPLMHLKLGFGDVIVAASASVAEQFLKVHDTNFISRPPNARAKYMAYNYKDLVFAPYGRRWRLLRKISSVHLFSNKSIDEFKHLRQEEVARLTSNLANNYSNKKAVNLGQLLSVCTTNSLARVMLGKRVFNDGNVGCDPKADEFKAMVVEMMVLAGVFNISDYMPSLEWFDIQGVQAKMTNLHKRFDAFLTNIIEEHETSNSKSEKHKDLLSTLLSLKEETDDDGDKLTDTEIKALLSILYNYGARKMALFGVGQIGCSPNELAQNSPDGSTCVERINSANQLFNNGLKSLVDQLNNQFPDARFIYINSYGIFQDIISNPSSFGLTDINTGCCGVGRNNGQITCLPLQTPCSNRNEHLFWDAFHPTEVGNTVIGKRAYNAQSESDTYPIDINRLAQI